MSVGDWDDSEEACRTAIELQPRESMWHNNLGWILLQRGRDREAMKAFDRALKLDRHNGRAKFNRAYGLREQGREAEATKELGRLLAEEIRRADASGNGGPHADDLAHQARMLGQLGRMPESREKLEAAVRAEPDRADLLGDLVAARVDLEEYEAAHEALARAREIAPESIDTLYAQGYLAAATGDVSLARPAAEAMERVHPTHRLTPDVAGYAAVCEEDWPRAADLFRRTLDRLPLRSCSQAWLAVALHRGGAADEAAGHAAQARQRCSVQCRCASIRALDGTTG